ncbi:Hypothetical predicted protein [Paramuricea clavata]|uniref:Uncharacterized protein n=1 Tax=Paramuricea clavata TaxID=317549 RepID=A0A7D9J960_PARCT|nr:Hypothetical predicted protein [Paramuricea clavata]
MPPVRRQNAATQQRAGNVNQPSVNDLRQQCLDKGLSDHGRRNTLVARLQQHASTSSSNSNATEVETRVEQTALETTSVPRENPSKSSLLNDAQLAQIQSIIARIVQQSVNDIATNAARAAVQAMASAPLPIPTSEPQHSANPSTSLDNATAIF